MVCEGTRKYVSVRASEGERGRGREEESSFYDASLQFKFSLKEVEADSNKSPENCWSRSPM